jgi:hypothetical protein
MKKIYNSLLIATLGAVTLGTTSCNNDDFLDVEHYTILPADQIFQSETDAAKGLTGCYDILFPEGTDADSWNFKPQLFFGCHPTLDTQATGWDKQWCVQQWVSNDGDVAKAWKYTYRGISRCNDFIAGLEAASGSDSWTTKKYMDGEARALRAYFYMFLAENWGKVPMLKTGETYTNTPNKASAETDDEEWDFIIDDLKTAASELDWKPYNGEYGRATKGMALSYLGEAYMWKAYKARVNGDGDAKSKENIQLAKDALEQVVKSGIYELAPSFSTLWDADEAWPKEAVWQVVMDMGAGNYAKWDADAHIFVNFFAGSTNVENKYNWGGGWGSEYLSWELYFLYENGDKRRDASMCTNPVPTLPESQRSKYCYGYNPFLQQSIKNSNANNNNYKFNNGGDYAPGVWTLKLWRLQRCQWTTPHSPCHFYYKRYAGVLLDYAECLFRLNGGNDATAWGIVNQIRNRAFGNLEVGKADALNEKFTAYYKKLANINGNYADYVAPTSYPIPFNTSTVTVPDAKTYYTQFASESSDLHNSFTGKAEVWQVALGEERRKEFSSEWNLKADLQRSDFLIPHVECDYPKGKGVSNTDPAQDGTNWHYYRDWDFNNLKLLMPIPTDELLRNNLIKQNPGY